MSLPTGHKLAHYEILEPIGAGGMGEVYRARDTKLGREVAIKVLPEEFAREKERLDRFEREARLLAQLNHANIAMLHGLEEHDGQQFLVMELVEGETLAERIAQGPLPVDEAIPLFLQIAEGLEAAHEKGVIHRDLKPANIKIAGDAKPKILDFGLAKAFVRDTESTSDSQSPTLTKGTALGTIMGTASYMSPEQARGKAVDKRTDIWAFGCVLYEALTGERAFVGPTVSDTVARILEREPNWQALPPLPAGLQTLLRRCLCKDADARIHDIADARIEIAEASVSRAAPLDVHGAEAFTTRLWRSLGWAALGGVATMIVMLFWTKSDLSVRESGPVRFAIELPESEAVGVPIVRAWQQPSLAISADGRRIVYVSREGTRRQLKIRDLDQLDAKPIPGSFDDGTHNPFFSPEGDSVAYFTFGELRKVSLSTGRTITLATTLPVSSGGCWGADGFIYYTDAPVRGLWRVPESGGTPESLTEPDVANGESGHFYPLVLDGGELVLFTIRTALGWNDSKLAVLSLKTRTTKILVDGGLAPQVSANGYLVYGHAGSLFVTRFDRDRLSVDDSAVEVLDGVRTRFGADYALSKNGVLAYVPSHAQTAQRALVWLDRNGRVEPVGVPLAEYRSPRLSPDGKRLAVIVLDEQGDNDIWVGELARKTLLKITPGPGSRFSPVWTPDGSRITFSVQGAGDPPELYWKPADGSLAEERIADMPYAQFATSWSPNGKILAFAYEHPETKFDAYILEPGREPSPLLASEFNESAPMFSPDGKWLAYESDESGRPEVYLRAFPGPGDRNQVSREGGSDPVWAPAGNEIYYRRGKLMIAVELQTHPELKLGQPEVLFEYDQSTATALNSPSYDVAPDGERFLVIAETDEELRPTQINVVLDWSEELERLVPKEK